MITITLTAESKYSTTQTFAGETDAELVESMQAEAARWNRYHGSSDLSLHDYASGEYIGEATVEQALASITAGPEGVIAVDEDGAVVPQSQGGRSVYVSGDFDLGGYAGALFDLPASAITVTW